jgi:hypothetical protein
MVNRAELAPLDARAAATLLDREATALRASMRSRVLDEAAGNPLALIELGSIAGGGGLTDSAGGVAALPLEELNQLTHGPVVGAEHRRNFH